LTWIKASDPAGGDRARMEATGRLSLGSRPAPLPGSLCPEETSMRTIENQAEDAVLNGLSAFLGIALFLAPWYLDLGSETAAARNAFACGATIAVVAMLALSQSYDWEEYLTLAIGLWVVAAPWALDFAEMRTALGAHVVIGLSVVALSGFELWRLYRSPEARSI
jgi:hypothetical protein